VAPRAHAAERPTYLEIPVDVLKATTDAAHLGALDGEPPAPVAASAASIGQPARLLSTLPNPMIWAGGGVLRSGAWHELARLAERLDAPVATTYMGKGSFPEDHPLAAGSASDQASLRELLASAGVVLCVGTELGSETTGDYSLQFKGQLIQIDADERRIGATYPALGLVGDAAATLRELVRLVDHRRPGAGAARARGARPHDTGLLQSIRSVLPREAITVWDMTILGYLAASRYRAFEPRTFLYPLGSGTLGFAWPAALGAKAAMPGTPVLAVVGDGGFMYGISELGSARQHGLAAKLLLVDDGGYGILREYQRESFGGFHGVDLTQPDFVSLIGAFGVPARLTSAERIASDLAWALGVDGPAAIVLRERLVFATPTA
jgi:acetolactate synthase I/II/III large subunit